MGILLQTSSSLLSEYAGTLLQTLLTLAVIAGLAYATLRSGVARSLLQRGRGKSIQLEETVGLDARNSLVIVQVEGRRLLLATHGQDTARLIAELAPRAPAPEPRP